MQSIKMKKDELLKLVKENRGKHKESYDEACVVYKTQVVKELKRLLRQAKKEEDVTKIEIFVNLTQPFNSLKDYDRVISMLQHETDPVIELSHQEYAQYVQDEWHWKQQFTATNAVYGDIAGAARARVAKPAAPKAGAKKKTA